MSSVNMLVTRIKNTAYDLPVFSDSRIIPENKHSYIAKYPRHTAIPMYTDIGAKLCGKGG